MSDNRNRSRAVNWFMQHLRYLFDSRNNIPEPVEHSRSLAQLFQTLEERLSQDEERQQNVPIRISFFIIPAGVLAEYDALQDVLNISLQSIPERITPVSLSVVNRLPSFPVLSQERFPDPCSICQETLKEQEQATKLPCLHVYHKSCLNPWFEKHNTCPICRYELPVDDPEREQERKQRMAPREEEILRNMKSCQLAELGECPCETSKTGLIPLEPCGHYYHHLCIDSWSKKQESESFCCPVCESPAEALPPAPSSLKKRCRNEMLDSCLDKAQTDEPVIKKSECKSTISDDDSP